MLARVLVLLVMASGATGTAVDVGAARAAVTGAGGGFTPATGRLLDTVTGQGIAQGPVAAGAWNKVQVTGRLGISSANAVQITITAVNPTAQGTVGVSADNTASYTALVYGAGITGTSSNTAIVALASDGSFGIRAQTSVDLIVDIQGYYAPATSGGGGYIPTAGAGLVANSSTGNGLPQGPLANGTSTDVQVTGKAGVPAGARAVFANFEVANHSSDDGFLNTYEAGTSNPGTSLNFPGGVPTTIGETVPLSASGAFTLHYHSTTGSTIDLVIHIEGYFLDASPSSGQAASSTIFTPATTRVLNAKTLSPHAVKRVAVAGVNGVPTMSQGLAAVAMNVQVRDTGATGGDLLMANDFSGTHPLDALVYPQEKFIRSNFVTVALSADGTVTVTNSSADSIVLYLDVAGWYSAISGTASYLHRSPQELYGNASLYGDVGDPVNSATGNFSTAATDLAFPNSILAWTRTVNSLDLNQGPLGQG